MHNVILSIHNSAKIEASVAFLAMNLMLKSKGYLPIIIEKDLEESKNVLLCNKGFSHLVEFMRASAIKLYDTCIEIKVKHSSKSVSYDEVFSDFDNIIKTESHEGSYYLTKDLVGTENFYIKCRRYYRQTANNNIFYMRKIRYKI